MASRQDFLKAVREAIESGKMGIAHPSLPDVPFPSRPSYKKSEIIDILADNLSNLDFAVERARRMKEAVLTASRWLSAKKAKVVAIGPIKGIAGKTIEELMENAGIKARMLDGRRDLEILKDADAALTQADWAIAETGTVVEASSRKKGRLHSLLPFFHVSLISARTIVPDLPALMDELHALSVKNGEIPAGITFISGPSKTADIEFTLTTGIHGPAEVLAIIIESK